MKVVINACFGGFGISDAAYEKLHEWGIPIRQYTDQERGPDGLWLPQPLNEGEVIFDRDLTPPEHDSMSAVYWKYRKDKVSPRYWDNGWLEDNRSHPLLIRLIEEMGAGHRTGASGPYADLRIVEIPDGTDYEIDEYDGNEHIAERHRTWR